MPTLPWAQLGTPDPGTEPVVMASRFEVRSLRHVPGFMVDSMRLLLQARRAPGALGVSLKARPLRRTFWTLSAWTDRKALYAYAGTGPHKPAMERRRKVMRDSVFVFWTVPPGDLPITWEEAERRLNERRSPSAPS
ncbi:DUF3291 domain-containing protein [Spirillospora sp. NPDC029432]|uniref:DUF3291 domain-containing protein n=1 Tax=Spirillospora sp. NPDC029432 TaxID=3154599 RepID=UPI003455B8E9